MSVMDKNFNVIRYAASSVDKAVIMDSRHPDKGRFLSHPRSHQRSIVLHFERIKRPH